MRKRFLAGEENPPPPDAFSIEIMNAVDSLPPAWRRLVHEYGFKITLAMYEESTVQGAQDDLETWRERRQEAIGRCDWGPNKSGVRESAMHNEIV
jgi:hypothetical protein